MGPTPPGVPVVGCVEGRTDKEEMFPAKLEEVDEEVGAEEDDKIDCPGAPCVVELAATCVCAEEPCVLIVCVCVDVPEVGLVLCVEA